jgi:hypothetical protein
MKILRLFAVLFSSLFICSLTKAQTQNLFLQPPVFTCNGASVTADFNHDGKPDIVCQDGSILLGKGDGTFTSGTPWTVSGQTGLPQISAADFNGDGKPDLFLVYAASTFAYVLLGNGDGTFQAPVGSNIGTGLASFIAVDINGDGKVDVLGISGTQVFVLIGKGDGTFAPAATYPACSCEMVVGDFTGDGKLDILLASGGNPAGSVTVLPGNGDGTFQPAITSPGIISIFFNKVVAGDINGDGKLDLVFIYDIPQNGPGTTTGQILTLLGNGNGTFQTPSTPFSVPVAADLALLDLNEDGKLDIVAAGSALTEIFLGNGNGTFTPKISYIDVDYQILNSHAFILTADFNGDGKPDLSFANKILIGNGDGTFKDNPATPVTFSGLSSAVEGDFNNDGIPDVAAISLNNDVLILLNDGSGTFSIAHTYTFTSQPSSIATADLNGDGKADLVIVTVDPITNAWALNIMLGNGDGSFGPPTTDLQTVSSSPGFQIAVADFNGDHKPDLAILNSSGSTTSVFLNQGDGTFGTSTPYFAGSNVNSLLAGDFNNDGKTDIVTASNAGLALLLGKGDGTFLPAVFPNSGINQLFAAADLNNDGNLDLIATSTDGSGIFLGNGDGTFTALPPNANGAGVGAVRGVADLNGDGKPDLVTSTGLGGIQMLLGNGDGTFGSPIVVFPGPMIGKALQANQVATSILLTGDFKHDSRTDLVADVNSGASGTSAGLVTFLNIAGPQAPDFLLSSKVLTPMSVGPGNSASSAVTLASIGGFTGNVTLSCTGLPSGATCNFSPSSLASPGTSALTITTTSSTPVGTYPIVVTGAASSLTHSASVTLVVAISSGATTLTLAPGTLTFASQAIGSTSPAQIVALSNIGSAFLTISNISIAGTNAADFALQNRTCATGISAGTNCILGVTFTPAGPGPRTANISITDNATGSPHLVVLNGSGPDFSLSPTSSQTVSVSAGNTATYTIAVSPSGGFTQSVSFSCTGAPALTTCTISPNPVSANGMTPVNATVTITTTPPSSGFLSPFTINSPSARNFNPTLFVALVFALLMILTFFGSRKKQRSRWAPVGALTLLLCLAMTLTSCGGGSSATKTTNPGTQTGTYSITVTGTVTSGSTTVTRATNLTLTVK